MAFILRIYYADTIIETEVEAGGKYTVGSSPKDNIHIKEPMVGKNCLTVHVMPDGWTASSKNKAYQMVLSHETSGEFRFEQIIALDTDKQLAISVFKSSPDYSKTIDISGVDRIVIGRNPSCDITIHSKQI